MLNNVEGEVVKAGSKRQRHNDDNNSDFSLSTSRVNPQRLPSLEEALRSQHTNSGVWAGNGRSAPPQSSFASMGALTSPQPAPQRLPSLLQAMQKDQRECSGLRRADSRYLLTWQQFVAQQAKEQGQGQGK